MTTLPVFIYIGQYSPAAKKKKKKVLHDRTIIDDRRLDSAARSKNHQRETQSSSNLPLKVRSIEFYEVGPDDGAGGDPAVLRLRSYGRVGDDQGSVRDSEVGRSLNTSSGAG